MAKRKKTASKATLDEAPLAHNPFAALAPAGSAPAKPDKASKASEVRSPKEPAKDVGASESKAWGSKLVLSREKKGRGGKTVTRITGLPVERLEVIAKKMKKSLGCGASVDGKDVLLHGALTERGAEWLRAQGAKRVIIGN